MRDILSSYTYFVFLVFAVVFLMFVGLFVVIIVRDKNQGKPRLFYGFLISAFLAQIWIVRNAALLIFNSDFLWGVDQLIDLFISPVLFFLVFLSTLFSIVLIIFSIKRKLPGKLIFVSFVSFSWVLLCYISVYMFVILLPSLFFR